MDKTLVALLSDLGLVFRHVLPGAFVLAALVEQYPHRFSAIGIDDVNHLLVLGIIALAAGNVAVFINRYLFLQLLEFLFEWSHEKRGVDSTSTSAGSCATFIAEEVGRFYEDEPDRLRSYIRFREAAGVFLMVAGEAALLPMLAAPLAMRVTCLRLAFGCIAIIGGMGHVFFSRHISHRLFCQERRPGSCC